MSNVRKKEPSGEAFFARHSVDQETPVLIYIGHMYTCKKELVDRLYHLKLSISYDRVLCLSAQIGNKVCEQFHNNQVVCPPRLRSCVFTTSSVDNIDYNPSSNTSKESFHGTAISIFQYLHFDHEVAE